MSTTKTKTDVASEIVEKFPQCDELAAKGNLEDALVILHILEKESRVLNDSTSNSAIIVKITQLCVAANNWETLCTEIMQLSKRKGLLKQAFTKLIEEGCTYVDKSPSKEAKLNLIKALRDASAGKMQVELYRARLTKQLALMREADGDIEDAANILQELQIENTGAMNPDEKTDFILEQMRLSLSRKDYVRAAIVSRRVNVRFFDDHEKDDLQLRYYKMMIDLDASEHMEDYFSVCSHYLKLMTVYERKESPDLALECLKRGIAYLLMSPFSPEQNDLVARVLKNHRKILRRNMEVTMKILKCLIGNDVLDWNRFCRDHEKEARSESAGIFSGVNGDKRWQVFENRVIEFNVRTMARYYSRVRLSRVAEMLNVSHEKAEEMICDLIIRKYIDAKIDRINGVVDFVRSHRQTSGVLTELMCGWAKIVSIVEDTCHLINREQMAHAAAKG